MNQKTLTEIIEAKSTICKYCESDMCEWCQVERVVFDAQKQFDRQDEKIYGRRIRSSTDGDYEPSNPWDAPGMSARDFI